MSPAPREEKSLSPEEKKAEVELRVAKALRHIENAQTELGHATALLSNFLRGAPEWKRAGKLYDLVHAFWYRVRDKASRYQLDGLAEQGILKRRDDAWATAKEHAAADARCGRPWVCACGPCRTVRDQKPEGG